jgi:hypothetical protein
MTETRHVVGVAVCGRAMVLLVAGRERPGLIAPPLWLWVCDSEGQTRDDIDGA